MKLANPELTMYDDPAAIPAVVLRNLGTSEDVKVSHIEREMGKGSELFRRTMRVNTPLVLLIYEYLCGADGAAYAHYLNGASAPSFAVRVSRLFRWRCVEVSRF